MCSLGAGGSIILAPLGRMWCDVVGLDKAEYGLV